MKVGDIITLKKGATYSNGKSIPSWVFSKTLYYRGVNANGIIFSTQKTGAVTGTVKAENVNEYKTVSTTKDYSAIGKKLEACILKVESLPEFKELQKLL